MDRLFVSNWSRWQSYRSDRGQPPWIKVHRELLRHWEWCDLGDAEKGQLVSIWILAADRDGELPNDALRVQQMCMLEKQPNIKRLIELGFLELRQDDATVTPSRRQDVILEAEAEAEAEAEREPSRRSDRFKPPDRAELVAYMLEKGYTTVDPDQFLAHYESVGWKVGKSKMKCWRSAVTGWETRNAKRATV